MALLKTLMSLRQRSLTLKNILIKPLSNLKQGAISIAITIDSLYPTAYIKGESRGSWGVIPLGFGWV